MRIARAARVTIVVAVIGAAPGGCAADGGNVLLDVSRATDVRPSVGRFAAGDAVANSDSRNVVTLTASDDEVLLSARLQGPISAGAELRLGQAGVNELHWSIGAAEWVAGGGLVECDGVRPYRMRFVGVPMRAADGSAATGSFVLDGSGTFD